MIRTRIHLVASLALGVCLILSGLAGAQTDPLPSWNDGPAKQGIVKFVQAVTDSCQPAARPARGPDRRRSTTTARSGASSRCTSRASSPSTG